MQLAPAVRLLVAAVLTQVKMRKSHGGWLKAFRLMT